MVSLLYYYFLMIIFKISNIKFRYKIIQKFYSYKYYGEIYVEANLCFLLKKIKITNNKIIFVYHSTHLNSYNTLKYSLKLKDDN